jgi:hypothetical protein
MGAAGANEGNAPDPRPGNPLLVVILLVVVVLPSRCRCGCRLIPRLPCLPHAVGQGVQEGQGSGDVRHARLQLAAAEGLGRAALVVRLRTSDSDSDSDSKEQ